MLKCCPAWSIVWENNDINYFRNNYLHSSHSNGIYWCTVSFCFSRAPPVLRKVFTTPLHTHTVHKKVFPFPDVLHMTYFFMARYIVASHASFPPCFTQPVLLRSTIVLSVIRCIQLFLYSRNTMGFRTEINLRGMRAKLLLQFQSRGLQRCHNQAGFYPGACWTPNSRSLFSQFWSHYDLLVNGLLITCLFREEVYSTARNYLCICQGFVAVKPQIQSAVWPWWNLVYHN